MFIDLFRIEARGRRDQYCKRLSVLDSTHISSCIQQRHQYVKYVERPQLCAFLPRRIYSFLYLYYSHARTIVHV